MLKNLLNIVDKSISIEDKLNTLGHHLTQTIIKTMSLDLNLPLLVTGGGAYNKFWVSLFKDYGIKLHIPDRLITDYSQILKDELAISSEQMEDLDLKPIIESVVDDFNNIYNEKKNVNIKLNTSGSKKYLIKGISNRVEQIIANLLDNAVSFSNKGSIVTVDLLDEKNSTTLKVSDEGEGFKESDIKKVFDRFYSNRPDNFGEHSGLGLNIVKNLVQVHNGEIYASNSPKGGAVIEINFPKNYN